MRKEGVYDPDLVNLYYFDQMMSFSAEKENPNKMKLFSSCCYIQRGIYAVWILPFDCTFDQLSVSVCGCANSQNEYEIIYMFWMGEASTGKRIE